MKTLKLMITVIALLGFGQAEAQLLKKLAKRAEEAAERTVERKVEEKTEEKTSQAIDSVFEAPRKIGKKGRKSGKRQDSSSGDKETSYEDGSEIVAGSTFFPDGTTLFSEDFSADAPGDFPANWETNAGGEIISIDGEKALRMYPNGVYIPNTSAFPENYAVDFNLTTANLDYKGLSGSQFSVELVSAKSLEKSTASGAAFRFSLWEGSDQPNKILVENWGQGTSKIENRIDFELEDRLNSTIQFTVVVNGKRLRIYVDGEKAVDVPSLLTPGNSKYLRFALKGTNKAADHVVAVHQITITEEGEDLRSMLLKGGFSTTKILFRSGSDQLSEESYTFLQKLGATLLEDPSLRIMIIGHTDSDGDAVKNMTLSKARAFSVANFLIDEMGIEKDRLTTQGRGENEPIAENNTAEGKAQNRRVEFKTM